ncbi:MAG: XRE family transcriptional regulator [Bdellovibrionales bacterium]
MKKLFKVSKEAKKMAQDLDLSEVDAFIMDIKLKLYTKCSKLIKDSKLNHASIAALIGTSRSRISRIANHGENNISIEILIKLIAVLEGKAAIKIAA